MQYYNIQDDYAKYPDAWCYVVWSPRGPGKTYSALADVIENNKRFIFIKRNVADIELMCSRYDADSDISPFNPLNRDKGWDIFPTYIEKKSGLAGFYHCTVNEDEKLEPQGKLLGWIVAASVAPKYKGFNMDADVIIFDEFIPKPWERINHKEGEAILDFYETVNRDRTKRGKPPVILVLLANATSLVAPMLWALRLTDHVAEMDVKGEEYRYLETGVLLHSIPYGAKTEEELQATTGIQAHMRGTEWGEMAYGGHFAYNDLTCIGKQNLKGYTPVCSYSNNGKISYVWRKSGNYYICSNKGNCRKHYNLSRESEQKLFFAEMVLIIKDATVEDKVTYESYSDYYLINNYRKVYAI